MNKIVTMVNSEYFKYGDMFLVTRNRIRADYVCYSPDLTTTQINILKTHNIKHEHIEQEYFNTRMQFAKFWCASREIEGTGNSLITFCDWDTFFVNDWSGEIHEDIALGITYRENFIKRGYLRAYANGGVIFFRNNQDSLRLCQIAMQTMLNGKNDNLPEYDEIWKTLESNTRPKHKRHFRENLRWWVDQVFLSALVARCRNGMVVDIPMSEIGLKFANCMIRFYNCKEFNHVESKPTMEIDKNVYIRHLKNNSGAGGNLKDGAKA
jgi:hypothetical protein